MHHLGGILYGYLVWMIHPSRGCSQGSTALHPSQYREGSHTLGGEETPRSSLRAVSSVRRREGWGLTGTDELQQTQSRRHLTHPPHPPCPHATQFAQRFT